MAILGRETVLLMAQYRYPQNYRTFKQELTALLKAQDFSEAGLEKFKNLLAGHPDLTHALENNVLSLWGNNLLTHAETQHAEHALNDLAALVSSKNLNPHTLDKAMQQISNCQQQLQVRDIDVHYAPQNTSQPG